MRAWLLLFGVFLVATPVWGVDNTDLKVPLARLVTDKTERLIASRSAPAAPQIDFSDRLREAYHSGYRDGYRDGQHDAATTFLQGLEERRHADGTVAAREGP